MVIVEVDFPLRAGRTQQTSIQIHVKADIEPGDKVALKTLPLVHPERLPGGENGRVVPVGLGQELLPARMHPQAGAGEGFKVQLVGQGDAGIDVPDAEGVAERVLPDDVRGSREDFAPREKDGVQDLPSGSLVALRRGLWTPQVPELEAPVEVSRQDEVGVAGVGFN